MRIRIIGAIVALAVGASLIFAATANAAPKVFVCKYVGTPGVDETLQTGQNPIEVSANAIPGPGPVEPGYEFADQQGRSVVVATESCGEEEPSPSPSPSVSPSPEPSTSPSPDPTTSPSTSPTSPPPSPSESPSPSSSAPPPPSQSCPSDSSVRLSRFFADPLINITMAGPGDFVIKGGKLRRSNVHVVRVSLDCGERAKVRRYHVLSGGTVQVFLNGTLVASRVAP